MLLDDTIKGVPPSARIAQEAVASMGWNLLHEDFDLPVCVLRQAAVENNIKWMQSLVDDQGALFAPHGKTYMSPALFSRQLEAGAWAITLATGHQVRVARAFGIKRIILANQLVGQAFTRYIFQEINANDDFEFYCLVDNLDNIKTLEELARQEGLCRPLRVFIELGYPGGRCGCRSVNEALALSEYIHNSQYLALHGVEGFEGYIHGDGPEDVANKIRAFLADLIRFTQAADKKGCFADGPILLSVGGSAFYDLVLTETAEARLPARCKVVTRSGCYLAHDAIMYQDFFQQIKTRSPSIGNRDSGLFEALEVWSYVLSRPEPGRVILNVGRRDISYDDLPLIHSLVQFEAGATGHIQPLANHRVVDVNDQHLHVECPEDSPVRVGDAMVLGVSHPCLTFDKWRNVFIRDDNYNIVESISTWF